MKFFGLSFFKSKKEEQLLDLKIKKEELEIEKAEKELYEIKQWSDKWSEIEQDPPTPKVKKPYKKLKLVNNVVTVVFDDGSVYTSQPCDIERFNKIRECNTEREIIEKLASPDRVREIEEENRKIEEVINFQKGSSVLVNLSDFKVTESSVEMVGTGRTIPSSLVESFAKVITRHLDDFTFDGVVDYEALQKHLNTDDSDYQALKRFFLWCCLNPRAEVMDKLYSFLQENSFRITKQGFFVALRNVVTVEKNNDIVKAVSNAYNKVKAVWKKKPSDFWLIQNEDEYTIEKNQQGNHAGNVIGNLEDLYKNLPNMQENRFTDDYTRTFDIRIGKVVSMPKEDCNWSTQDCAASGLKYVASL